MDLALVEKFISAMSPARGKSAVHTAFECMKAAPESSIPTIGVMIAKFQYQMCGQDENSQAKAMGNLLTGVMIARASEITHLKKHILEDYLEQVAKIKGENVTDLFQKKAEK